VLISQMLELNKKVQEVNLDHEKTLLSGRLMWRMRRLINLVYEWLGLTVSVHFSIATQE
jgi:hypothetical protein